jgi:tRNA dimethylallyltransferase
MGKTKAVAIVGPTASGKTSLAIEVAKKFNGEVVSVDSRQVYRGLDLGTGKVTKEEMDGITHHLIDIIDPQKKYNAAEFELDATAAILDISSRGKLPIITGGTFFYLDMLRGKHQVPAVPPNEEFRKSLDNCTLEELNTKLEKSDPERAASIDKKNRPRIIRALEIIETLGHVPKMTPAESPYNWLVIGIDVNKIRLHQNIHNRLLYRLKDGLVKEAEELHKEGLSYERMHALGLEYRYLAMYLQQEIKYPEMVKQLETKIRQYAKRQMTWLKKDKEIEWYPIDKKEKVMRRIHVFLSNS